MSLFTDVC